MIVNLIKARQMFMLILPDKVKGQYWIHDVEENGKYRRLISIEEIHGEWILKSNRLVKILDSNQKVMKCVALMPSSFICLSIENEPERVTLFAEEEDISRKSYRKYVVREATRFSIGRTAENDIIFENDYVSGRHAILAFDGRGWKIQDQGSTNGTYVNHYRVNEKNLTAGDFIYIMGLKIIVGHNFFAVNNPGGMVEIGGGKLYDYSVQVVKSQEDEAYTEEEDISEERAYFFRSPRFCKEIEKKIIHIDPPPQPEKIDRIPIVLMLGPSVTMALASVSTAFFSVQSVLNGSGEMIQAMPTLIMAGSMMLGTLLWPILTKRYEKKEHMQYERNRQEKYLAYLDEIRDVIGRTGKQQRDILCANLVGPDDCIRRIMEGRENLWERVIGQRDFLMLRTGTGRVPLQAEIKYQEKKFTMIDDDIQNAMLALGEIPKEIADAPVSISILSERLVGVIGEYEAGMNMLKYLTLQMIALHGYDELKLVLILDEFDGQKWEFAKWVPHFWNDEKTMRYFAANDDEVKELSTFLEKELLTRKDLERRECAEFVPYYVIISTSRILQDKCEAFRKMLGYRNNCGFSILMYREALHDLPKETKTIVMLNGGKSQIFNRNDTNGRQQFFVPDYLNEYLLEDVAERISNIALDMGSKGFSLPGMLTFLELFRVGKVEHLNALDRWKENNPTISLQTPVGVGESGDFLWLDLHERYHGPHGLIAGMTGSGKSEFIITYILSMAVNYHPDEVAFILIDYKGGGLAGAFEDEERGIRLPHLAGTITNLDGSAVKRALTSIQSELRHRQAVFNEARRISNEGTMDIYKYQKLYRDNVVSEPVPHLFIISDEFAELKSQQPEFMDQLISTARIGRSLGVHLLLATQKPNGVVDDQIWSNSRFRICLKVQEKADSQDMIKCPDAAELSQTGRFYLQVGFNELFLMGQSAWCGAPYKPADSSEKTKDTSVRVVDHIGRVMMTVKAEQYEAGTGERATSQIVEIVKYLSELANEEGIAVKSLWLPPIPEFIYVDELERKYHTYSSGYILNPLIGEYDDPFDQKQGALRLALSQEGNCLIYGSTGNGKSTFLTTLCYSLIKNHSAEEVQIYIMDFGSETLKVFEDAPQVGDVVLAANQEKTVNLLKMLSGELDRRKVIFGEYGGDYQSYCSNTDERIPNIVVLVNNYSGFAEQYESEMETFMVLTRDGVKYGIYFVVAVNSVNDIRYKTAQNFKQTLTLQLNDTSDYSVIVGKTDGMRPYCCKGRGLVNLGKVYEFQTAYCKRTENQLKFLRDFCGELTKKAKCFASKVPVLPDTVNAEYLKNEIIKLEKIPLGINKKTLEICHIDCSRRVLYPVVAQDLLMTIPFIEELIPVLERTEIEITLVDSEKMLSEQMGFQGRWVSDELEHFIQELFNDMVTRNNDYVDAKRDSSVLARYKDKIIVIMGVKHLYGRLSEDGKDKFNVLMENAEAIYGIHFIMIEDSQQFGNYAYENWYKIHINGSEGLWIGDGVANQSIFKLNKFVPEFYEEIGSKYGYLIRRNKPILLKLLSAGEGGESANG